jgi:hypothetical protein
MQKTRTADPCSGGPPAVDLCALYSQLLTAMGGPVEVETPQLGRVMFPRPTEIYAAMNYLRMEALRASGASTAGVIVIGYDRGLGPGGCL